MVDYDCLMTSQSTTLHLGRGSRILSKVIGLKFWSKIDKVIGLKFWSKIDKFNDISANGKPHFK
jgi:hypothetical protein